MTTMNTARAALISLVSDQTKDIYGFRPEAGRLQAMSLDALRAEADRLRQEWAETEVEWLQATFAREQAAWEAAEKAEEALSFARKAEEAIRAEEATLDGWYAVQEALAGF